MGQNASQEQLQEGVLIVVEEEPSIIGKVPWQFRWPAIDVEELEFQ